MEPQRTIRHLVDHWIAPSRRPATGRAGGGPLLGTRLLPEISISSCFGQLCNQDSGRRSGHVLKICLYIILSAVVCFRPITEHESL